MTHSAAVLQRALEKGGEMLELHLSLLRDRFAGDLDGLRSAVNAGDHAARDTPFMQAVWAVQAEAARVLLRSGADVNAANAAGRRALHHSACPRQEGNEEEKDQVPGKEVHTYSILNLGIRSYCSNQNQYTTT